MSLHVGRRLLGPMPTHAADTPHRARMFTPTTQSPEVGYTGMSARPSDRATATVNSTVFIYNLMARPPVDCTPLLALPRCMRMWIRRGGAGTMAMLTSR